LTKLKSSISAARRTGWGEAVVCGPDGDACSGTVSKAMMYAFDLLELDGQDLRGMPLSDRKMWLARLVGKRRLGIVLSAHTALPSSGRPA
jgi:hypothetical protein